MFNPNEMPQAWIRLITIAGKMKYGKIEIIIQNGRPVRIDSAIQQIKLDTLEEQEDGVIQL